MTLQHVDTMIGFSMIMLLLSMLVTTLVQLFHLISFRRGRNLLWGLIRVLEQSGLNAAQAKQVACKVLCHPSLSAFSYATAIRVEELARVLPAALNEVNISQEAKDKLDAFCRHVAPTGQQAAEKAAQETDLSRKAAENLLKDILAAVDASNHQPLIEARKQLEQTIDDTLKKSVAVKEKVDEVLEQGRQLAQETVEWFNQIMDRTTERFLLWSRWVTVLVALALSFTCHIDSIELLKKLSTDDKLRESIVAGVNDTFLQQTEEVLASGNETVRVASAALTDFLKADAAKEVGERLVADATLLAAVPDNLRYRSEGSDWLKSKFGDAEKFNQVDAAYREQFDKTLDKRTQEIRDAAGQLMGQLEESQLVVFDFELSCESLARYQDIHHLGGVLITALLISLGAPFWFNVLKNFSNLRPVLAKRVQQDEEQSKPAAEQTPDS